MEVLKVLTRRNVLGLGGLTAAGVVARALYKASIPEHLSISEFKKKIDDWKPKKDLIKFGEFEKELNATATTIYNIQNKFFEGLIELEEVPGLREQKFARHLEKLCTIAGIDLEERKIEISNETITLIFKAFAEYAKENDQALFRGEVYSQEFINLYSLGLFRSNGKSVDISLGGMNIPGASDSSKVIKVDEYYTAVPTFEILPGIDGKEVIKKNGRYNGNFFPEMNKGVIYIDALHDEFSQPGGDILLKNINNYRLYVGYNEAVSGAYIEGCAGKNYVVPGEAFGVLGEINRYNVAEFFGDYACLKKMPEIFYFCLNNLMQYDPGSRLNPHEQDYGLLVHATSASLIEFYNKVKSDPEIRNEFASQMPEKERERIVEIADTLIDQANNFNNTLATLTAIKVAFKNTKIHAALYSSFMSTFDRYAATIATRRVVIGERGFQTPK